MKTKLAKRYRFEPILQFVGDVAILYISLWIAVFARLWQVISIESFIDIAKPYTFIFIIWILVFLIDGLYERKVIVSTHQIATSVIRAQIINGIIAITFFYFLLSVNYTSRSILLLEVLIAMLLIIIWRSLVQILLSKQSRHATLIISDDAAPEELVEALSSDNANHPFSLSAVISKNDNKSDADIKKLIEENNISFIITDTQDRQLHQKFPSIAEMMFGKIEVLDIRDVYEALFQRVPHSLFDYHWYMDRVKRNQKPFYMIAKRVSDIFVSLIAIIISLPLYPFIALAIKLEDFGPVFIKQPRIGKDGKIFNSYKFRSMKRNEDGVWIAESDNQITKVGKVLRKSRLDELPQLFAVLFGHISLVGPRPDMAGLEKRLTEEITHYNVRSIVKPGITGWALIKQVYIPQSVEETRYRLSYDLYYIKNRSAVLDFKILLQTIRILLRNIFSKD